MANILSKRFELSSGFTISVQPLPPYYVDFIKDELPFVDFPKRKVTLAAGDVLSLDYTPTEVQPDPSDIEEYELYITWHAVASKNKEIQDKRERMRRDYLLANCISIEDGPVSIDDNSWFENIEAIFGGNVIPTNPVMRRVAFLKSTVIRTTDELKDIINAAIYPEVTMQGITNSLHGFRAEVGQAADRGRNAGQKRSGK